MASLDFYAAREDLVQVLEFLFSQTDVRIFESYSCPDEEIVEFSSVQDLDARYPIGINPYGNAANTLLKLWSPSMMPNVEIIRFGLNPEACNGHTFRYRMAGWGLMQLYLGGTYETSIVHSHFGHNSQARARAWGEEQGVDWKALSKISNKIQYHIRKRLAIGIAHYSPLLPQAMELVKQGCTLKHLPGNPWKYITLGNSRMPPEQSNDEV